MSKFIKARFDNDKDLLCPECNQPMNNYSGAYEPHNYIEMWKCDCGIVVWEEGGSEIDTTFFQIRP